jgi:hypothetical protein
MVQAQNQIYENYISKHTRIHLPSGLEVKRDVKNDFKFSGKFSPNNNLQVVSKPNRNSLDCMG